jgi:hypothetical protein
MTAFRCAMSVAERRMKVSGPPGAVNTGQALGSTYTRGTTMTTSSTTTTLTASAEPLILPLPPVDCAGWCRSEDGHADARFIEDQYCVSDVNRFPLTAEKLVEWDEGQFGLTFLETYLLREAYSTRTLFRVTHSEEAGVTLTRDEALALREALDKVLAADELERS